MVAEVHIYERTAKYLHVLCGAFPFAFHFVAIPEFASAYHVIINASAFTGK